MAHETKVATRFLRLKAVTELTGLSRSGIYLLMKRGEFPIQRKRPGQRAVVWLSSEVDAWCEREAASLEKRAAEENAVRAPRDTLGTTPPLDG